MNFEDETLIRMSAAKNYNLWILSKIKPFIGKKILEVGCGIGSFTRLLARGGQVTAVDINPRFVRRLKEGIHLKTFKISVLDIEKLWLKSKFESIVCLNVLEHIENDVEALKNMSLMLRKESTLILLVPSHPILFGSLDEKVGHYRRYELKELTDKINRAGLIIKYSSHINRLGAIGWFINARIFRKKLLPRWQLKIFDYFSPLFLKMEKYFCLPFGLSLLVIAKKK